MAEHINNLIITTSNASRTQRAGVTVRMQTGAIAAKIYSDHSKPLNRIRKYMLCHERLDLIDQLKRAGVSQDDIDAVVAMKEK